MAYILMVTLGFHYGRTEKNRFWSASTRPRVCCNKLPVLMGDDGLSKLSYSAKVIHLFKIDFCMYSFAADCIRRDLNSKKSVARSLCKGILPLVVWYTLPHRIQSRHAHSRHTCLRPRYCASSDYYYASVVCLRQAEWLNCSCRCYKQTCFP